MRPRRSFGSKRPTKTADKTAAVLFLLNARTIDHVVPEEFAGRYRLPVAEARRMVAEEKYRRAQRA